MFVINTYEGVIVRSRNSVKPDFDTGTFFFILLCIINTVVISVIYSKKFKEEQDMCKSIVIESGYTDGAGSYHDETVKVYNDYQYTGNTVIHGCFNESDSIVVDKDQTYGLGTLLYNPDEVTVTFVDDDYPPIILDEPTSSDEHYADGFDYSLGQGDYSDESYIYEILIEPLDGVKNYSYCLNGVVFTITESGFVL